MTWHATEMPDDALDRDSLVGRMLNADPVRPEPVADAAELPLRRVMLRAFQVMNDADTPKGIGGEIEALRDHLLPEEPPAPDYINSDIGWIVNTEEAIRCDERQRLRAILTEQARIARGEQ